MTFRYHGWRIALLASILAAPTLRAEAPASPQDDSPPAAAQPNDTKPLPGERAPQGKASDGAIDPSKPAGDAKSKDDSAAAKAAASRRSADEYFELYKSLADTLDQVERNYVKPVDRRELMEAAIKGVLGKLDPYSNYIGPEEMGGFRSSVESQFGGIGIQITVDEGQIKVSSPLVGTPAYRAGVQAGDRIIRIEGESTRDLALDEAVRRLKGEVGTSVTFTVQHALTGRTETFTIKREMIHVDTVLGDVRKSDDSWNFMLDPDKHIGYIRITAFGRDTAADLKKAVEGLQQEKLRGLILDLRFNPGGLLTSAIEVADLFLDQGRIVSTTGRNTKERVWDAVKPGTLEDFPMVVLVNRYSASASEIVAACLQDHHRASVIGERTWGKGSVQNVIELEAGKSALKLTTATYTRPNGHNIHRFPNAKESEEWGVKPNDGQELRLSNDEMTALLDQRRLRDIVKVRSSDAQEVTKVANTDKPDGKSADKPGAESENHNADEQSTVPEGAQTDSRKGGRPGSASRSDGANQQKSNPASPAPFVDRQLQKGLELLTTELARAQ